VRRTRLDPCEEIEGQLALPFGELSDEELADRIRDKVLAAPCLRHHEVMASCPDCRAWLTRRRAA